MVAVMASARRIHGEGTPEAEWQAWPGLTALPEVGLENPVPPGHRAVVVAPHPDDEVLGAGGLMALLSEQRRDLLLIAVTDGTGSHPGSTHWPPEQLARERPLETERAVAELGWPQLPVVRLGLEDGGLSSQESDLTEALATHLRPRDIVFTTFVHDGHPDHEATARACIASIKHIGAQVVQMPIWSWHWAQPADPRLPWPSACHLTLSPSVMARKRQAVAAFLSQTTPDSTSREGGVRAISARL